MNIYENEDEIKQFTALKVWGTTSLDMCFRLKSYKNKDAIGLSGYSLCKDEFCQLSYSQIQNIIDKTSQHLLFSGLNSGDVVALQLPNSIETQILYYACWQQGIAVAPIPSLWRENEIKQALIRISPQAYIGPVLHDGFNYTELMYKIGFDISSIKFLFSLGGNPIDGCIALDELFDFKPKHNVSLLKPDDYPSVDANSTCLISFSKDQNGVETPYYHTHNQLIAAANLFNSVVKPIDAQKLTCPFAPTSLTICAISTVSWALSEAALVCYDGLMATEFQNIDIENTNLYLPSTFCEEKLVTALFEQGVHKLILIDKADSQPKNSFFHEGIIDVVSFGEFSFLPIVRTSEALQVNNGTYSFPLLRGEITDHIEVNQYSNDSNQLAWQIGCSFLPTNIIKKQGKLNTHIICSNPTTSNAKLNVGNMMLNFVDIERELLAFHGIEDVAILAFPDNLLGLKPIIAVVPKVGAVILHHELVEYLTKRNIPNYKIPQELYKIPNIPRDYENNVIRITNKNQLLKLVGPQNSGSSDGLLAVQQELASLLANA